MSDLRTKGADEIFCPSCGNVIKLAAEICPHCGVRNHANQTNHCTQTRLTQSKWLLVLLLSIFLGCFGAHRFYVGKIGTGILYLFTLGLFGIGAFIDLMTIASGNFRDKKGELITNK